MTRPIPLDKETADRWAARTHLYVLDALMLVTPWSYRDVAFHGGTSLHFSYNSPRRSEDIDFLLARDAVGDVGAVMKSVERRLKERFLADDPFMHVQIADRTKDPDRMPNFMVSVSHRFRIGKVKVKVEFWRVDREYLMSYPTEFRTPVSFGDMVSSVSSPVPAARLSTAFADKLTAFATRPFLKWRDIFDMWWIGTQTNESLKVDEVCEQFIHNLTAYSIRDEGSPSDALRQFLARDEEEIFAAAERDLKPWLPSHLWHRMYPNTVREMIAYCRSTIAAVADQADQAPAVRPLGGPQ